MRKRKHNLILDLKGTLLLSLLLGCGLLCSAQGGNLQRFDVGLVLGVNAAQIEGDPYKGYRKFGLQAGVEGMVDLGKKKQLSLGFLFNQIGSAPSDTEQKRDSENYLDFRMTYIEIPLLIHFQSGKKDGFYTTDFHTGVSLSRLLSSRIVSTRTVPIGGPGDLDPFFGIIDRQEQFNDFTPSWIVGISRYVHPNWGVSLRHTLALQPFFEPGAQDDNLQSLNSFFFSLRLHYVLR